jgi:hypothetical protein
MFVDDANMLTKALYTACMAGIPGCGEELKRDAAALSARIVLTMLKMQSAKKMASQFLGSRAPGRSIKLSKDCRNCVMQL